MSIILTELSRVSAPGNTLKGCSQPPQTHPRSGPKNPVLSVVRRQARVRRAVSRGPAAASTDDRTVSRQVARGRAQGGAIDHRPGGGWCEPIALIALHRAAAPLVAAPETPEPSPR